MPSLFLLCQFFVLFMRNSRNSIDASMHYWLNFFLGDIFFATLWVRALPPPHARPPNLICQAHRSQVLMQPNSIRRKNSYKLESTQTKFSVRTCNFGF